jgi:hypothetical protein
VTFGRRAGDGDKSAPLPTATLFKPFRGFDADAGIQESEPQIPE